MSEPLALVAETAQAWREVQAAERVARERHVDALRQALRSHGKEQVAEAAGVSYQSVYKALARRDGRRNVKRTYPQPVPIELASGRVSLL